MYTYKHTHIGLVRGGDMIKKFGWSDVRGYLAIVSRGGSI